MVIIAIMLDPPSIHVPNFEFAVGAMFIQTSFGFERKPTRPVGLPVFSGETSWKSMLPSANTQRTHQPINLSSGISPKLMHCATGDDFFETSANRRLDHLHYVWNLQKFLPMS